MRTSHLSIFYVGFNFKQKHGMHCINVNAKKGGGVKEKICFANYVGKLKILKPTQSD